MTGTFHKVSYVMPMRYTDSEIIDLWLQRQSSPASMADRTLTTSSVQHVKR